MRSERVTVVLAAPLALWLSAPCHASPGQAEGDEAFPPTPELSLSTSLPTEEAPAGPRQARWGFSTALSTGGMAGNFGKLLRYPIGGEFNFFRSMGAWRFGAGVSFTSFKMEEPLDAELEWGYQRTYLFATRAFRRGRLAQPYIQIRAGLARLHPRSELFAFEPPPEKPGDSPTKASNGGSVGILPGVEFRLNRSLALDVSGHLDWFHVSEYDLSPAGYPNASAGTTWEARLGLRWHPDDGWPSGPPRPGGPERERDAWGVSRNLGWAVGETLAINLGASAFNEYVRNANFNQISPRSWWRNLKQGFTFDDNEFRTNQIVHPFNGAAYYNAGRANGHGFWGSSAFALGGAFFWECCGETHPMSYNDIISTGIGGIAYGEAIYRLSSQLLDNTAKGRGRRWREIGGLLIDPVRGLNRAVSGRWGVHDNPAHDLDWRPAEGGFFVFAGARVVGEGESITNNTKSYGFLGFEHGFGSVFDNPRRKPFDSSTMAAQLSFGDEKNSLTIWRIRGDLYSRPLGSGQSPRYAFAIVQHFDYHNNNAYEFGQQAFGPSLFSRFRLSDRLALRLRADASAAILAAVNADYSFLADVANRERYREYDYGPGLGANLEAALSRSGRQFLSLSYRYQWVNVTNGSVFNKDDERGLEGSNADHYLQAAGLRLNLPVFRRMSLGADGLYLLRRSQYYSPNFRREKEQRHPELRAYLAWQFGS